MPLLSADYLTSILPSRASNQSDRLGSFIVINPNKGMKLKKLLVIFVLTAASIGIVAGPAQAASMSRVISVMDDINDKTEVAANAGTISEMMEACDDHLESVLELSVMKRPKAMPKASWQHLMKFAEYSGAADIACSDGDFETATSLLSKSTNELKYAKIVLS
jgi:hypothetical protein